MNISADEFLSLSTAMSNRDVRMTELEQQLRQTSEDGQYELHEGLESAGTHRFLGMSIVLYYVLQWGSYFTTLFEFILEVLYKTVDSFTHGLKSRIVISHNDRREIFYLINLHIHASQVVEVSLLRVYKPLMEHSVS